METEIEKENYTFMKEYLPEMREKVNESQVKQILSLENIKDIPKMMKFWTGLPNYETFYALYHFFRQCPGNFRLHRDFCTKPIQIKSKETGIFK